MQNETKITCPKCNHSFKLEEVYMRELEASRQEFEAKLIAEKETEKNKAILEAQQKIRQEEQAKFNSEKEKLVQTNNEMNKQLAELQQVSRAKKELENQVVELQNANKKIQSDVDIEIQRAVLNKEKELRKENELNQNEWKKIQEEKQRTTETRLRKELEEKMKSQKQNEIELMKIELEQKHQLELKIKDEQLSQANKKAEELSKNLNQGSSQVQGEAQEKLLSERLKEMFIFDDFSTKTTGKEETDIEQTIIDNGSVCGKIVYESKNTKVFNSDWIQKLKKDGQNAKADSMVLVTQAMPKSNSKTHLVDNVWVCSINDFEIIARTLRHGIIKINRHKTINENKHDKMIQLYNFMNSKEFQNYMEAVFMGITKLKESYEQEKNALQKIWKQREKEFLNIYENASAFIGAVKGISGIDTTLFELPGQSNLLE
jgi:hypothetical protein